MNWISQFLICTVVWTLETVNGSALANIYTWPNGENHRHYTNSTPPSGAKNVELFLKCSPPRSEDADQPAEGAEIPSINEKGNPKGPASMNADSDVEILEMVPEKAETETNSSHEAAE